MVHEYMEMEFQAFMPSDDDEFDGYVLPHDSDEDFDPYILPDDDEEPEGYLPEDEDLSAEFSEEAAAPSIPSGSFSSGFVSMSARSFGLGFVVYEGPEPEHSELDLSMQEQYNDAIAAVFTGRLKMAVIELTEQLSRTCAICLDEMAVGREAAVLDCFHKFHEDCLRPWLAEKLACPYCRAAVEVDY